MFIYHVMVVKMWILRCEDLLADIFTWRQQYCHLDCYIAGDFNTNLNDTDNAIVKCISFHVNFICSLSLSCADVLFPNAGNFTYVNNSLQHYNVLYRLYANFMRCQISLFANLTSIFQTIYLL